MIFIILYDNSLSKEEKIMHLSPNKLDVGDVVIRETIFLRVHHALHKLLITYYGFDNDTGDILRESFLNFLKSTDNFMHHSKTYFGMWFSERTKNYISSSLRADPSRSRIISSGYKVERLDIKYIRFCFEKAPFEFAKHFLLCVNGDDTESVIKYLLGLREVSNVYNFNTISFFLSKIFNNIALLKDAIFKIALSEYNL